MLWGVRLLKLLKKKGSKSGFGCGGRVWGACSDNLYTSGPRPPRIVNACARRLGWPKWLSKRGKGGRGTAPKRFCLKLRNAMLGSQVLGGFWGCGSPRRGSKEGGLNRAGVEVGTVRKDQASPPSPPPPTPPPTSTGVSMAGDALHEQKNLSLNLNPEP